MRPTPSVAFAPLALLTMLALGACSTTTPNDSGSRVTACRPISVTKTVRPSGWTGSVFVIVMENHDQTAIIGSSSAPYINVLAHAGVQAAGYHTSFVHPSKPNYLWMVSGENFGVLDDDDPSVANTIASTSHLADQLERAGFSWRSYQESMGAPCGLSSHGEYAVKHNPFVFFADVNGSDGKSFQPSSRCMEHVVDYAQLDADLAAGTVPDYVFITPNLIDDMHDGTVSDGDAWLSREVPKILASDAYRRGGALFLLWDEGANDGDSPPFVLVSPNAKSGFVSQTPYDTSSFLATVEAMFGLDTLPCNTSPASVARMDDLVTVPLAAATADAGSVIDASADASGDGAATH